MIKITVQKKYKELLQNFTFNSSRVNLEKSLKEAADSISKDSLILDAGAGDCIYKHLFSHVKYECADICKIDRKYGDITYICDLSSIPVPDNKYDAVIFTQVLEHISEPKVVLKELHRILKPGGKLFLSAPLFYEEHEIPYDYYRYTQFGLKYLLEAVNLQVEKVDWLEGYFGVLSYQLKGAFRFLSINPKNYNGRAKGFIFAVFILILRPLFFILSVIFAYLDVKYKYVSKGYCKNYFVVASKKK